MYSKAHVWIHTCMFKNVCFLCSCLWSLVSLARKNDRYDNEIWRSTKFQLFWTTALHLQLNVVIFILNRIFQDKVKFIMLLNFVWLCKNSPINYFDKYFILQRVSVADPGRTPKAPQGSRFFHFDLQILWNVAVSWVGAPYGNPGSATVLLGLNAFASFPHEAHLIMNKQWQCRFQSQTQTKLHDV